MTGIARESMLPALKTIWQVCFEEQQAYVDFAFERIIRLDQTLVSTDASGEPVAMLCMQPAHFTAPSGRECTGVYIYGVATLPRMQGKGLSTELLEFAHKYLKKKGFALSALVPASQTLFVFYKKRGYEIAFSIRKVALRGEEMPRPGGACVLVPSSLDRVENLRDAAFRDSRLFVKWDRQYLSAIQGECRLSGGETLRYTCEGGSGYVVCYRFGKKVLIKEITADDSHLECVLAALHRRFGAEEYLIYLRPDRGIKFTNDILPFAAVQWYDRRVMADFLSETGSPAYLAHVLD